jgi:hypothetical protein
MTTFERETGWHRHHPQAICQDIEALQRVQTFTYDLLAPGFVAYFTSCTGCDIAACVCGWHGVLRALALPDESWAITKGKLQDCWELFTAAPTNA